MWMYRACINLSYPGGSAYESEEGDFPTREECCKYIEKRMEELYPGNWQRANEVQYWALDDRSQKCIALADRVPGYIDVTATPVMDKKLLSDGNGE